MIADRELKRVENEILAQQADKGEAIACAGASLRRVISP